VTATLAGPDGGLRAVHARYLVGCDGVHSRVRGHSRIAFPGTAPEQLFAVADVRFAERPAHTDTTFFFSPHGLALLSELPGAQHRVVAAVTAGSTAPSGDEVEKLLTERTDRAARVSEVVAASTYHVQQRVADRFGDGPVFLCGDAAHTHSPAGAQGMNTGIQDAANLAWKLHEVVNCGADAALLESYHRERHAVAEELVRFTSQITALATLADPDAARLRNDAIAAAATAPGVAEWIVRRLSQLDIAYPVAGTAACDPAGGALVGRRLPPSVIASDGLAWTLAVPDRATRTERIGRLSVHAAPGLDTTVLVRPDGYVAAAGVPADPALVLPHFHEYVQAGVA
jgi:2-polyprenyl-6-methoxyphenol hydroxylase-like FAD-dependent oxidoreductase